MLRTEHGMKRRFESVWRSEQKPHPTTKRPPQFPGRINGRVVLASKYLYLLQVLFFICPLPGKPAGHGMSGSRWKAGDFLPECFKGNTLGSTARLFLSFESHEFRLGQVPSSSFLVCDSTLRVPGVQGLVTPGYWKSVGSISGTSILSPPHMYLQYIESSGSLL